MKLKLFLMTAGLYTGLTSVTALAATTTGAINATLTLTTGCLVNGQSATTGVNFGTLNFGSSTPNSPMSSVCFSRLPIRLYVKEHNTPSKSI